MFWLWLTFYLSFLIHCFSIKHPVTPWGKAWGKFLVSQEAPRYKQGGNNSKLPLCQGSNFTFWCFLALSLLKRDWSSPDDSVIKNPPAKQETQNTQVWSLHQEGPLEKEMATYSSMLAWEIPWMEKPGGLQSMGSQKAGHNLATKQIAARETGYLIIIQDTIHISSNVI